MPVHRVGGLFHILRQGNQLLAIGSQCQAIGQAVKQAGTQTVLQRFQAAPHRRLTDLQHPGGGRKITCFADA